MDPGSTADDTDDAAIRALYRQWVQGWNARDAEAMTASLTDDADVIGFDGSEYLSRAETASSLAAIFADHTPARYVAKVRSVRLLAPDVGLLRAVVGMVPPGESDLHPERNAHQTLVARRLDGEWRLALFQNTPARFDGRPDLAEALTEELRQKL